MTNKITLLRYTDPNRTHLARAAAIYLGKDDIDNIRRPLGIMKKRHALAIFRGESARFEFETSKVVYDHLITYTTADMRACAGLRANEPLDFVPPAEDEHDPVYESIGKDAIATYKRLIHGHPDTRAGRKKKQAARSILPTSVKIRYQFQFNFLTLIHIFQQRIWTPGAQKDTYDVVWEMWRLVHEQDPELWDTVESMFGPEEQQWLHARLKLKKENPDLYYELIDTYGKIKTMW